MKLHFKIILFLYCLFAAFAANAQSVTEFDAKSLNKQLDLIEKELSNGHADSSSITQTLKTINNLQTEINQAKTIYSDKLQNVQKRLSALGEAPKDGTKEAAEIAANRKTFSAQEDENKAKLAQIELMNAKIEEINNLILKIRNQTLFNRILVRQTSIFQIKEFGNSILSFGIFIFDILKSPYSWYIALDTQQQESVRKNGGYAAAIFTFIILLSIYLNIYIRKQFGYRDCKENPTYTQKLQSAGAMAFSFGLIPAVTLGAFLVWLNDTEIINVGNWGRLLYLAALYLLSFFLILATVRVVFVPKCGNWRIVNMEDKKAKSVSRAIIFSAAAVLLAQFLLQFAEDIKSKEDIIYSLRILAIMAKVFAVIYVGRKFLYTPVEILAEGTDNADESLSPESKISLLLTVFAILVLFISLFGYVRLAEYIINRFLFSLTAAAVFWLFDKALRYTVRTILHLSFWQKVFHVSPRFLVKIEFWFGILLKPFIWIFAIIALLGIWGFSVDIMLHDIKNFLLGFNIGGMHVSIVSIILGFGAFIFSMFIFKSLKRSIQSGQLSKIEMQEDSRNSLAAGIGLIGFIVSLMIAFAVMGGSLSSIALIAGALSFGVGLGMQNIVSNFVSGIIIIFERPIKIGDWVVIGGQEGIVKSINMRSTRIESFNKSDIIIPNSTILSGTLINMTYSNRTGRLEIKLHVNFNSDIQNVENALKHVAESTPGVLSSPPPTVAFTEVSGSQLGFLLNCYTANIYNRQNIINMIWEKIITEFPQRGIILK